MAENDDAVLTAAVGYVYTAPPGTPAPSASALATLDPTKPSTWGAGLTVWDSVGHTSRGTLPEFGFEGGDSEVKGSWQKKKLREITSEDPVDYLTVVLHQFDEDALSLYYGENESDEAGVFGVSGNAGTNEKAVLVIIVDGDFRLGHHAHKSGVKRDDAIELPIDDLAALPVRFTYLNHEDELLFTWINEDLFNVDETP
ncbi:major tail protein [Mycobacterium phage Myxus]|uniref:Major tail protein n=6 Tax=Fromanvirus packman TaxID=1034142 RepID=G1BR30_9CAUD|nr:major tail protein [Mycobacterium phage Catalina]YP_009635994.1 major tail protein [Mycobacterium phage PackMan]AMO43892.1 major tail protein [Mycobacterium phage Myxus]AOQ28981.1 major tail protein [Mycobacterium phage HortumSL17]AOY12076.1 major tail protein [Mycobacterium phage Phaeder]QDF20128.1 major tail protein [Mycobacterium phage Tubs]QGH80491.1 major tail protein [Mycobacterium phage Aliter]UVF60888.1 major tail protein [Mycobacterium phage Fayely]